MPNQTPIREQRAITTHSPIFTKRAAAVSEHSNNTCAPFDSLYDSPITAANAAFDNQPYHVSHPIS